MKAALFEGPGRVEVREVPTPECGDDEALIKVFGCAVCGTDIRIYASGHHNVKPPAIIGHEVAGVIVDVGKNVKGYSKDERVTLVTEVGCTECEMCRKNIVNLCPEMRAIGYQIPGGFADYILIPKEAVQQGNIIKIPEGMSIKEALVIEPLSCVINGQSYLNISGEDFVVVIGAGPIGYMHSALAKARGARVLIADISEQRLRFAKDFKLDYAVNSKAEDLAEKVKEYTDGKGADVVIVACSVKQMQEYAFSLVGIKGRISLFGGLPKSDSKITIDSNIIHYKEVSVFGAFASHHSQYGEAVKLIVDKKIDASKFITNEFPLVDIVKAYETVKQGDCIKVIVLAG